MIDKEIAEIRRRYKSEKSGISRVRGCFVNTEKTIISEVDQSLGLMTENEADQVLSYFKKTLSGGIGINLLNIDFATSQVNGEEHGLLMRLRNSELGDQEAAKALYQKIIDNLKLDDNYMILLACDTYDVMSFTKDGQKSDDCVETFKYIICAVCPAVAGKPSLSYQVKENCFKNFISDTMMSPPQIGFMFPAFDNRATNLYGALYYTKRKDENHLGVVNALFGKQELPMPATVQTETFKGLLAEAAGDACSMQVIQSVHAQLSRVVEDHKEHKDEPLVVDKYAIRDMLESCGVSESGVSTFEEKFDKSFGIDAQVNPQNMMNVKKFEVRTPDVVIKVAPDKRDLVETRVIDGVRYIMIRADEGAEVNGINICMENEEIDAENLSSQ